MKLLDIVGFVVGCHLPHVTAKDRPVDAVVGGGSPSLGAVVVITKIGSIDMVSDSIVEVAHDALSAD